MAMRSRAAAAATPGAPSIGEGGPAMSARTADRVRLPASGGLAAAPAVGAACTASAVTSRTSSATVGGLAKRAPQVRLPAAWLLAAAPPASANSLLLGAGRSSGASAATSSSSSSWVCAIICEASEATTAGGVGKVDGRGGIAGGVRTHSSRQSQPSSSSSSCVWGSGDAGGLGKVPRASGRDELQHMASSSSWVKSPPCAGGSDAGTVSATVSASAAWCTSLRTSPGGLKLPKRLATQKVSAVMTAQESKPLPLNASNCGGAS
mmetsp:Transcript_5845/g.15550  ORF Transcript_5845/g.15550 Transcript_5845/m.15550 type:complete len:264 (+) Transcript_5845:1819-2610(+)